jgi:hypothetical protein
MRYLLDVSATKSKYVETHPDIVAGQLITPLTGYRRWSDVFAIDNGAYSGLRYARWLSVLRREKHASSICGFVCCPDLVGQAKTTLEMFYHYLPELEGWRIALVAQDGMEDLDIPWHLIDCLFLGGKDPWKDSAAASDLIIEAKIRSKHAHIGRVNHTKRYVHYLLLGADTCDGSGISRYPDAKLPIIQKAYDEHTTPRT